MNPQFKNHKEIDKLAMTGNYAAVQMQKDEISNKLREASNIFSFLGEAKIKYIAERLQDKRIGCYAAINAIDKIIDNYDKFPSFKILVELCATYIDSSMEFKCEKCYSQGLQSWFYKPTGQAFAFRCDCPNGGAFLSFKSVNDVNINHFTKIAPCTLEDGVDPYFDIKERWQEYINKFRN